MTESLLHNISKSPLGIPLSHLTAAITNAVIQAPGLTGVWVTAELSDVRVSGGHCYMELIEKNEAGQTVAKLRATIWRNSFVQLRQKFYSVTGRDIANGIKALVRGGVNHHSLYGISFNITDIDPSYTIGDLERLRQEILMKLHKEGVASLNKNIPFPQAPQKIAVISAEGAAGYGDFMDHLLNNSEGFVFYPCLFNCAMQGDKVSESVRQALHLIESTADIWDCVAIVRGGGATTDLNGFDDYELARAVATCGLPVVVGIGHERDRNVLDEIANVSLKTPTAVANFFIDKAREAYDKVISLADRLRLHSTDMLRGEERRLSSITGMVPQLALHRLADSNLRLQSIISRLPLLTQGRLGKENVKLDGFKNIFSNLISSLIVRAQQKIISIEELIKVLDPKNTLLRGYSITRVNGKAIKSIRDVKKGDILVTTLADGEIKTTN